MITHRVKLKASLARLALVLVACLLITAQAIDRARLHVLAVHFATAAAAK